MGTETGLEALKSSRQKDDDCSYWVDMVGCGNKKDLFCGKN